MIELFVYPFDDRQSAWEVHAGLMREPYGFLAEAGDVAIVWRDKEGGVRLARVEELAPEGPTFPWRALIDALMRDGKGVNEAFASTLRARLGPGQSALFVLKRQFVPNRVFNDLRRFATLPLRTLIGDETLAALQD
jgi:uncharacterized membrane protein